MRGEFAEARGLIADSRALLSELGVSIHTAVSHDAAYVALASGDAPGAEAALRGGYDRLTEMGERALLADTAAMLAQVVYQQGRAVEAWAFTREAEDAASEDDLSVQVVWRSVRARLLALVGRIPEAKRLSGDAVELASRTDWLTDHADALIAHAEVLRLAGEAEAAAGTIQKAIALYDRKGNAVGMNRARSLLAAQVAV
jgi:ATP/maltotriose-dependent transcriptional regulator MalT